MRGIQRVGLGVIDQGLSSVSNALFLVAVARVASVDEFGAVGLAYALFVFGLTVQRSSIGTLTSLVTSAKHPPPVVLSLLAALVVVAAGLVMKTFIGLDDHPAYYVILLSALVIYPQDLLRYVSIAQRRVALAVVSDGTWFVVTLALFALSFTRIAPGVTMMTVAWVVVGAGVGLAALVIPLRRDLALRTDWWGDHAYELRTLGPDALLSAAAPLVLASVVAHYMSLQDVAAVRGAGTLLGPLSSLFSAIQVVLLPEMARIFGGRRVQLASAQAALMSLLVLVWGGCLFLLPGVVGEQILGDTWSATRTVLIWATLELMVWALASGPVALLTSYRRWQRLLGLRVIYILAVACALALTVGSGDIAHVMIGMVAASAINLTLLLVLAARERARVRAAA